MAKNSPAQSCLGCLILIVGAVVGIPWIASKLPEQTPEQKAQREKERKRFEDELTVIRLTKDYIREHLKFPHDADFNWLPDDVRTNAQGTRWFVLGKVKAKNSFGAELTYEYSAIWFIVEENGQRPFKLVSAAIGDKMLYKDEALMESPPN